MTPNNYGYIENGKTSIDVPTLENIVKIFNISLIEFFESDDPKFKIKQTNKDQATGNLNVNQNDNSIWQEVLKAKDETIEVLKYSLERFVKS
jgi:transcriptional regulator with XRE-family HTH domain